MNAEKRSSYLPEIATPEQLRAGTQPDPALPPQIPDHELIRHIGGGSYGQVWLARNAMGGFRAVKAVYRRSFERDRPYEREFEGIQKFEPVSRCHPGFVDILHVGRNNAAGYFYYVMELADDAGDQQRSSVHRSIAHLSYSPRTLGSELRSRGRLPLQECLQLGLSLADALKYLHEQDLVHRDIKPSNIIFVDGIPKLADVGLVADAGQTLSCVGTDGFIAPEGPGSPQADLYSLGKVLYEISTGKDRHDYPAPLTNLAELPDQDGLLELNEVIFHACARDPRKRYASAQAMRRDLLAIQSGRSVKRIHLLERRLAWATRTGCIIAVLLLLVGGAWLQASRERKIAAERLVRLQADNALRHMDEGDLSGALPWVTESLRQASGDASAQEMHRYRFESIWRRLPRLRAVCLHKNRVYEAGFSPDGNRFITASADDTAQVWDTATGKPALPPLHLQSEVLHALYTPDGKRIVTIGRDATLQIWDAQTAKPLCPPRQHRFHISSVAFSADGKRIVTGSGALLDGSVEEITRRFKKVMMRADANGLPVLGSVESNQTWGEAQVFDSVTGRPIGEPFHVDAPVEDATFSPDGQRVAIASDGGTALLWDIGNRKPSVALKHQGKVRRAVFSPDGARVLTASEDHTAQLWDARTGQPAGPPMHHADGVLYAAFSRDGKRMVTTSRDQTACLWDAETSQLLCQPLRHQSDVWYAEFSPDGNRLVTAGSEPVVRVWNASSGELLALLRENDGGVFATFSPVGERLVTVSRARMARLWDLRPLAPAELRLNHPERVNTVAFNPRGTCVLTAAADSVARVWNASSGAAIASIRDSTPHQPAATSFGAAWSPDGHSVVPTQGNGVFNGMTGELRFSMSDPTNQVNWAELSPHGDRVFIANTNGTACVWDARSGRRLGILLEKKGARLRASFSRDSHFIAVAAQRFRRTNLNDPVEIQVWDTEKGKCLSPVMEIKGSLTALEFNPNGRLLLTAASEPPLERQEARLWDWRLGKPTVPPLEHLDGVNFAVFSPDGRLIATASSDRTARIWDTKTGQPATKALRHSRQVNHIAFSPDGRRVVTACEDGSARVWDVATGEAVSLPLKHGGPVVWAEFSPDGRRVATASVDGTARIWDVAATDRPIEDLELMAELLSGQRIDSRADTAPLSREALQTAWQTLRKKYPAEF